MDPKQRLTDLIPTRYEVKLKKQHREAGRIKAAQREAKSSKVDWTKHKQY